VKTKMEQNFIEESTEKRGKSETGELYVEKRQMNKLEERMLEAYAFVLFYSAMCSARCDIIRQPH
jgi:hypothetical protein